MLMATMIFKNVQSCNGYQAEMANCISMEYKNHRAKITYHMAMMSTRIMMTDWMKRLEQTGGLVVFVLHDLWLW